MIVGRESEVGDVGWFLLGSEARALLLEGPAGVGKTTVWRAAIDAASRLEHTVLITRPLETETSASFSGLTDLLGGLFDAQGDALPAPQRDALGAALLRTSPGDATAGAVSAGTLGLLRTTAQDRPVLVAVDDLQWLDQPTAAALRFALRRCDGDPVPAARHGPDRGAGGHGRRRGPPAARRRTARVGRAGAHRSRTSSAIRSRARRCSASSASRAATRSSHWSSLGPRRARRRRMVSSDPTRSDVSSEIGSGVCRPRRRPPSRPSPRSRGRGSTGSRWPSATCRSSTRPSKPAFSSRVATRSASVTRCWPRLRSEVCRRHVAAESMHAWPSSRRMRRSAGGISRRRR